MKLNGCFGVCRCLSEGSRAREGRSGPGSQLVQHHAPWCNLTSMHLGAGASHMRCTRCTVQPGAPTTVMHQGAGAHRWWCTAVHGAPRCMEMQEGQKCGVYALSLPDSFDPRWPEPHLLTEIQVGTARLYGLTGRSGAIRTGNSMPTHATQGCTSVQVHTRCNRAGMHLGAGALEA